MIKVTKSLRLNIFIVVEVEFVLEPESELIPTTIKSEIGLVRSSMCLIPDLRTGRSYLC
jgi:hypothetical protein